MKHSDVPIDKSTKYARVDSERRFLLSRVPPGLCVQRAEIDDRYITGRRLRLRRTIETTAHGSKILHKLTQKIPGPDGGPGLVTNTYLNDAEYHTFRSLPANALTKVRYRVPPLSVDIESAEEQARFGAPVEAIAEVTLDARLTGGWLALLQRPELLAILAEFGVHPVDASELATRSLSPTSG